MTLNKRVPHEKDTLDFIDHRGGYHHHSRRGGVSVILIIISAILLFALSAFCKAAMDARVFQDPKTAFQKHPAWFREWMQRRGKIPVIKIDDGWHMMQMIMFLCLGLAYLLIGAMWQEWGYWILLSIPARTVIHGAVFELTYPLLTSPPG